MQRHPGIQLSQIPVAGPAGIVFALGMVLLILIAIPAARPFMVGATVLGTVGGLLLHRSHS